VLAPGIVSSATDVLADSSTITLISDDGDFFNIAATHDRDPAAHDLLRTIQATTPPLRIHEGSSERSCTKGVPCSSRTSTRADARHRGRCVPPYVTEYMVKSMLVVPVRARARILGTFSLARRSGHAFTEADLGLACDIADRAGLAMDNARLYARAEEARTQAEAALARAEAAVRGRDNVLAIVSHDLRKSPLGDHDDGDAARGGHDQRDQAQGGDDPSGVRAHGAAHRRPARHRPDRSRRVHRRPSAYDVGSFLAHAAEVLAPVLVERDQRLAVSGCDARIRIDRERFLQVIANLVGNASKFGPPSSTISLDAAVSGDEIEIGVTDDGPGIPPAALGMVFDRFAQSSASGSARRLGVGLGLTIARGIVEAHGGQISAENVPPRGARFRIVLPRVVAAKAPTDADVAGFFSLSVEQVRRLLDSAADHVGWEPGPTEGISLLSVAPGGAFGGSRGFLVQLASGVTYPLHEHDADETVLMLHGGLRDDDGAELWAGDWVKNVKGTSHASTALDGGCLLAARIDPSARISAR
jgi:signal transduction histidine kinase